MLVMKFGGTSVGDAQAITRLITIVKSRLARKPVVVVSAVAKTTDKLMQAALLAEKGELAIATEKINELKKLHLAIANELIGNQELLTVTTTKINNYFSEIESLLNGVNLLVELSNRSAAKIITYGEFLSSVIVSAAMTTNGINNSLLDARSLIFTNDSYLKGEPDIELINQKAPTLINNCLQQGRVVITQGFVANTKEGIITTLGRGGSDYSASLLGMTLGAEEIEIWTDVDGMLTADPRKVKNTKLIKVISFAEAAELAYFGAKVLHPLTIQPALEKNIPVRILNSMNPLNTGTLILPDNKVNAEGIKSIACKENITVLNIYSTRMLNAHGFLKKIFEVFDQYQVAVDVVATSEVSVSLTIDNTEKLPNIITALSQFSTVNVEQDKSLVCVVGQYLKQTKGIATRVFQALGDFNVTMISQGASAINLSFVVNSSDLSSVVQKLHDELFGDD